MSASHHSPDTPVGGLRRRPVAAALVVIVIVAIATVSGSVVTLRLAWTAAITSGSEQLEAAAVAVETELLGRIDLAAGIFDSARAIRDLDKEPLQSGHEFQESLLSVLAAAPYADAMIVAYTNGRFLRLYDLRETANSARDAIEAPVAAAFAEFWTWTDPPEEPIGLLRYGRWVFRDLDLQPVGERTEIEPRFDPKNRDWFKAAMKMSGLVATAPRMLPSSGRRGFMLADLFGGFLTTVLGLEVAGDWLTEGLQQAAGNVNQGIAVVVLAGDGQMLAATASAVTAEGDESGAVRVQDAGVRLALNHVRERGMYSPTLLEAGPQAFLATVRTFPLPFGEGVTLLAASVPFSEFERLDTASVGAGLGVAGGLLLAMLGLWLLVLRTAARGGG